jgi:Vault protein inter-alpha-trypsin domain
MKDQPDRSLVAGDVAGSGMESGSPRISRDRVEAPREHRKGLGFLFLVFGVALPAFTLGFELFTHACAAEFFDPIPTWWHVGLVAAVPLANFLIWRGLGYFNWRPSKPQMLLAGASIAISAIYALMYAPMAPFACIGIMFVGFGFLPLAPIIAFALSVRAWLKMPATAQLEKRLLPGAALGLAALAIPFSWDAMTYALLHRATTGRAEQRNAAVSWLRQAGHWDAVLFACYRDPRMPWTFLGGDDRFEQFRQFDQSEVQKVYYRLTGVAYNSQPAPASVSLTGRRGFREWNFDSHLGGERVADKVPGLTLEGSRLDTKVEPVGLTSYTEWTLVFKNIAVNASEARAQIELPPDGVVSRLTLWINGEPQEAAFGGRSQVRAAYQEVAVVQRRDPVLVTTSGPDRVLMQCFPVPPNGGEMKVRLGITAPLRIRADDRAAMRWPTFVETNFEPGGALRHSAWVESPSPLANGQKVFQAQWEDDQLAGQDALEIPIGQEVRDVVTDDPTDANYVIRQTISKATSPKPSRTVIVIDGSREMKHHRNALLSALGGVKPAEVSVLFAGDSIVRWPGNGSLSRWIDDLNFAGGCDNLPALEAAWEEASREPGGAVVWIHGPQPVLLSSTEVLRQRIERSANKPALYLVSARPVPNLVTDGLNDLVNYEVIRDGVNLEERLERWLPYGLGGHPRLVAVRERVARSSVTAEVPRADRHLARLWGHEEVERMRTAPAKLDEAIKLALNLQLVTPVSGAVVLERKEQYDRHGLKQVDPSSVPTIPEPTTASLVAGALLWYGLRRSRRTHA